jgi:hypothetical protein
MSEKEWQPSEADRDNRFYRTKTDAEYVDGLRAALARFADRKNWYFEGDHMCPEWTGKDFPWDVAAAALTGKEEK